MKTYVYIDGFNLYYGSLKGTPHRWLDVSRLCSLLLPSNQILKIKYFTANITSKPSDPHQATRQQTYFRALKTIPNLEIHLGHFLVHPRWMPLDVPYPAPQIHANSNSVYVRVIKTEEKGSDVNLATHMLSDGFDNLYDAAVIISNDSDLVLPIRVVRNKLGKSVGVLNPQNRNPSRALRREANFFKPIRHGAVAASQFNSPLTDSVGNFTKPATW